LGKIVLITETHIRVKLDDGTTKDINPDDVMFRPRVGDEVEFFSNEDRTVLVKISKDEEPERVYSPTPESLVPVGKKAVNKLAYCLLAFFLGGIGIHKFYGGKIVWGIIYICFCWTGIPAIIAFVEFIIALFKKSDRFGNIYV